MDEVQIKDSIDYIECNLCDKIRIVDLANRIYLSEFYFHRLFSKATGETVAGYIRKRRMTQVAKELVDSNERITDLALKYQFSSQESFARTFKMFYGKTPREYRKQMRAIHEIKNVNRSVTLLAA